MRIVKKMYKSLHKKRHLIRNSVFLILSVGIICTGIIIIWLANTKLPDFQSFEERKVANSTKIYDRTGEILLYDVHQDIKRTVIPFEDMGQPIRDTTIAIEDWKFYSHNGIRPTSIVRAILTTLMGGKVQGGSTITQQVIKNTLLTQEKTITRKLKEWVLAIKLERVMSKDEILATYLNDNPYGGNIYGIQQASQSFFGKNPIELTIAEAAYLAAIPQSPTYFSPYGSHKTELDTRKDLVLSKMHDLGYITDEIYTQAKDEVVEFKPRESTGIKAPHFVFFIIDYLNQKYGEDVVDSGGLKVVTTLDYKFQQQAEELVAKYAAENEIKFKAKNAGMVAIDPKTGQILAMVGSRNYFDTAIDGNFNITLAKRQPGSSFKPFVYSVAFNKGYTPDTVLFDVPTEFSTGCDPYGRAYPGYKQNDCYMPHNYDNTFRGPISLRNALAQSINVPAVKLLYLVGIDNALKLASDMGISTLVDKNTYGLTLVLGGGEVTLLEMTSAYGTFATGGIHHSYASVLEVQDHTNNILESFVDRSSTVLPKNTASLISNVLSDNIARIPTFGVNSPLYFPNRDVAVKTGTTNNNRDAWIVGYTPSITIGVWAGNNENTPMTKTSGYIVADLWHDIMNKVVHDTPNEPFELPEMEKDFTKPAFTRGIWEGGETFFVDSISGMLATNMTPKETLIEKPVINIHSILYWINKNNLTGGIPLNPNDDNQFRNWDTAIQNWWEVHKNSYQFSLDKPTGYDQIHTETSKPVVSIINPVQGMLLDKNQPLSIQILSTNMYPLIRADYFFNNSFIGTVENIPFSLSFTPNDTGYVSTQNTIRVIVTDSVYNKSETAQTILFAE